MNTSRHSAFFPGSGLRRSRRFVRSAAGVLAFSSIAATLVGCAGSSGRSDSRADRHRAGGTSALLLVLADADLPPESFVGRVLAPVDQGATDLLTVVQLPLREPRTPFASVAVPNAVQGPPMSIAATPDGRFAFVTETRAPRRPTDTTIADLQPGARLTSVDLTNPGSPRVIEVLELPGAPMAVAVHPDGVTLAVACAAPSPGLVILRHNDGRFDTDPIIFDVVATSARADGPAAPPTCVDWHPSGRYLAITIPQSDTAAFYEFNPSPTDPVTGTPLPGPAIAPWGDPVRVGGFPYAGAFTPDGRHFITTDLRWNTADPDFLRNAPSGSLTVVQLAGEASSLGMPRSSAQHRVAATVTTAPSPEGIAVSRDGSLVAVACLGDVLTAPIDSRINPRPDSDAPAGGVVHLYRFDHRTGALLLADTRVIDGAGSAADFGPDNNELFIAAYRSLDHTATGPELMILEIRPDFLGRPRFAPGVIGLGVPMPPHTLRVVPVGR